MKDKGNQRRAKHSINTPQRQTGLVLIIGDGESERIYFERLSDLCISVGIRPYALAKTGPDVILRKTREYVRKHGLDPARGDLVAIVMDLDNRFEYEVIESMAGRCRELGYELFISNPSFEVWLLCHFELPTHPYTPVELMEEMDRVMGRRYGKSSGFDLTDPMVDKAIRNSRRLLPDEECNVSGCFKRNPSTMVHALVESIRGRITRR